MPKTKAMILEVLDITMFAVLVFSIVKLSHMLRLIAKISLKRSKNIAALLVTVPSLSVRVTGLLVVVYGLSVSA